MSRITRLFELIGLLRARRTPVTAAVLSRKLGVTARSVYRDIETLRSLGAPIDGQSGVGYALGEGFFLPQLAFTQDELDALVLGLGWVRERADPALAQGSESALAKVLATGGQGCAAGWGPPALVTAASASGLADPPQAALLRDAIRRQRKVAVRYEDAGGSRSERTIWPIAVVHFDDVRLVVAWCETRSDFRHFRIDRVQVTEVLADRYPGRRQALLVQWRKQDRDWRALLTDPDAPTR